MGDIDIIGENGENGDIGSLIACSAIFNVGMLLSSSNSNEMSFLGEWCCASFDVFSGVCGSTLVLLCSAGNFSAGAVLLLAVLDVLADLSVSFDNILLNCSFSGELLVDTSVFVDGVDSLEVAFTWGWNSKI